MREIRRGFPASKEVTKVTDCTATNIALAGTDLSINRTPMQTLNLMKTVMKSRAQDAANDIGNFFQGSQTAFNGKAPAGLGNIVDRLMVSA